MRVCLCDNTVGTHSTTFQSKSTRRRYHVVKHPSTCFHNQSHLASGRFSQETVIQHPAADALRPDLAQSRAAQM